MTDRHVIVVTGAASGMGRAAATRWAKQGHAVAGVDLSGDALKEIAGEVPGFHAFECDVTDGDAVLETADRIRAELGQIDRLVNAAGICIPGTIGDLSPAGFRTTMAVNYFGTVHWVDAVIRQMRARGRGEIVLFSSVGGFLPGPGVDAYVASKFAVLGYAEVLRQQTSKTDGIRVVCLCPPAVDTPLLATFFDAAEVHGPAKRLMQPMTPDRIVESIERALQGRGFLLLPGPVAKGSYLARRLAPNTISRLVARFTG